jgi:hypothetical protein
MINLGKAFVFNGRHKRSTKWDDGHCFSAFGVTWLFNHGQVDASFFFQ